MPLISSRSSGSARAFGFSIRSALASILELFSRSDNPSSLGSIRGQKWKIWRGAWQILSNKAFSNSSASNYPLATLTFTNEDVEISISGADPGMGMSFWVTDSENWYATVYTQNEACETCSNCNSYSGGNCASYTCNAYGGGTCNSWTCNTYGGGNCASNGCTSVSPGNCRVYNSANTGRGNPPYGFCHQPSGFNAPSCNAYGCISWNSIFCAGASCNSFNPVFCNSSSCTSYNPVVCNAFFTFSCNCVTEHRISIIKSLSGTISTVATSLFSSTVQSFKSLLSGENITISAYSNIDYTSQIGSPLVGTESSPQKTKKHGIIKSESNFAQGNSIEEFKVEK